MNNMNNVLQNYYDDHDPTPEYAGMQPGWTYWGMQDPQGLVPRPRNYVPFDSLCWRDGRHAHDPNDWGYPQLGGGAWPYAQGDTPSAPGFPTNQSIDLRMRERPDYGTIGDRYGAYGNFGDMYGPYCGPFGPEWCRARATNRGWR